MEREKKAWVAIRTPDKTDFEIKAIVIDKGGDHTTIKGTIQQE